MAATISPNRSFSSTFPIGKVLPHSERFASIGLHFAEPKIKVSCRWQYIFQLKDYGLFFNEKNQKRGYTLRVKSEVCVISCGSVGPSNCSSQYVDVRDYYWDRESPLVLEIVGHRNDNRWLKDQIPTLNSKILSKNVAVSHVLTIYEIYCSSFALPQDLMNSFLFAAVREGTFSQVEDILKKGADVNARDHLGRTPLHVAAEFDLPVASVLLKYNPIIDAIIFNEDSGPIGATPLHIAIDNGKIGMVKILLEGGASAKICDQLGRISLCLSLEASEEIFEELLRRETDLLIRDYLGNTSLHLAVLVGEGRYVGNLLARAGREGVLESYLEAANDKGETALILAAKQASMNSIELLLKNGAKTEVSGPDGRTALHWASYSGDYRLIQVLREFNANLEAEDEDQMTPLHVAIYGCNADAVEFFLLFNANKQAVDRYGKTPLMVARSLALFFSQFEPLTDVADILLMDYRQEVECHIPNFIQKLSDKKNAGLSEQHLNLICNKLIDRGADAEILAFRNDFLSSMKPGLFSPLSEEEINEIPIVDGRGNAIPFMKVNGIKV